MKLPRIWKLYIIFLLLTILIYPKIACSCSHSGNLCYLSLPFLSPFLPTYLPIMSNLWSLSQFDSVFMASRQHFFPNFLFIILLPALSIILYRKTEQKKILPDFLMKNKYVPALTTWMLAAIIILIFDFIYNAYFSPFCLFGIE